MASSSYRDLIVWQKSMVLIEKIYQITSNFPSEEKFNLTSQLRRSAVSIASNIAEGSKRGSRKEFINFLNISYGSLAELETQVEVSIRLKYIEGSEDVLLLSEEISKMLNSLIRKLKTNS